MYILGGEGQRAQAQDRQEYRRAAGPRKNIFIYSMFETSVVFDQPKTACLSG